MREFSVSIGSHIESGLRPDDRLPVNSGFMTTMQNIRLMRIAGRYSASVFSPPPSPFSSGYLAGLSPAVTVSHPFPQIFKGSGGTLMASPNAIYSVSESTSWTVSKYTLVDAYDVGTEQSLLGGYSWHFADFGSTWMLVNGNAVVFKTAADTMFGAAANIRATSSIMPQTCCAFRGRMVMGGFVGSTGMWNERWETVLRSIFDLGLGIKFPSAPGTNYVWWSQIGDGGLFLIYPDMYINGLIGIDTDKPYGEDNQMFWDMVQRNEMGFMPMRWQGTVYKTLPLGNGIMVYGSNGVSYMPKRENTFGLVDILPYGVAGRSAAGGTDKEHVFVDSSGTLWKIDENMANNGVAKKLGFTEFFDDMLGTDITISHDPLDDEYHIANSSLCYILSGDRLTGSTFLTTSTAVSLGVLVGLYSRPTSDTKDYAILTTDIIDLGIRGTKCLERVVISSINTAMVSVAVYWRNKSDAAWTLTPYRVTNNEGVAYFPISALEFKIVVRCTDYTKVDFDDVDLQFKVTDKRIVRGTYALKYKGGHNAGEDVQ